ncbi:PfkB family carbohydrate kinase [Octadecabacter sp.]|nr:PfkB family carbohydrate kinase [Octadecabacter sp.]
MTLLVVGALHWDVVVGAPRLPQLDETLRGRDVIYQFGGKGGNQAVAATKAGAQVGFAGRIGADEAGTSMRLLLEEAGVDLRQLQQGSGASGMSVAIVTEDGDYGAVIVSAENHAYDASAFEVPAECAMVLLQNEMRSDVLPACAAAARKQGTRVVWNAAPASDISPGDLALVDTLIVNRVEAADILDREDVEADPAFAVASLSALAPKAEIILTLGGDGVVFAAPEQPCEAQPAHSVDVISTHGAGDVFVGTFAAGRLQGMSLSKAVAAGQQAAALHISQSR